MDVINIAEALASFTDRWRPFTVARINNYDVRIVKVQGEFVWHTHRDTDELILVISGELTIQMRGRDVVLGPQDVFVIPRGTEHCPRSDVVTSMVLFELRGTGNAGAETEHGSEPGYRPGV